MRRFMHLLFLLFAVYLFAALYSSLGLVTLVVWLLGVLYGGYLWESNGQDRTVAQLWRDWRGGV